MLINILIGIVIIFFILWLIGQLLAALSERISAPRPNKYAKEAALRQEIAQEEAARQQKQLERAALSLEPQYASSEFMRQLQELISLHYYEPKEGEEFRIHLYKYCIDINGCRVNFETLNYKSLPDTTHLLACGNALASKIKPDFKISQRLNEEAPCIDFYYRKERNLRSAI